SSYIRNVVLNGSVNYAGGFSYRYVGTGHVRFTAYQAGNVYISDPFSSQPNATGYSAQPVTTYANNATKFNILQPGGELSDYVVAPENVSWQKSLSINSGAVRNDYGYAGNQAASYTSEWMGDNVWLPSISEAGANWLWKTTPQQRANAGRTWLRSASASNDRSHVVYNLDQNGNFDINTATAHVQNWYGVRPAFHLNLSEIEDYFVDVPTIGNTNLTYNRQAQTINISDFDTSKVKIKSVTRAGSAVLNSHVFTDSTLSITAAGEYTIEFETKTDTINGKTAQYIFNEHDESVAQTSKKIKITVNKATLETPGMGTKSKEYDGSTQIFTATNYITQTVSASPPYP
ncbi:MAG: hypothetical protein K2H43_03845, partial [Clostridia bacterium]|nr:hypothetical protein [Clostridia bacterium]